MFPANENNVHHLDFHTIDVRSRLKVRFCSDKARFGLPALHNSLAFGHVCCVVAWRVEIHVRVFLDNVMSRWVMAYHKISDCGGSLVN
jgi:hypothetical protein